MPIDWKKSVGVANVPVQYFPKTYRKRNFTLRIDEQEQITCGNLQHFFFFCFFCSTFLVDAELITVWTAKYFFFFFEGNNIKRKKGVMWWTKERQDKAATFELIFHTFKAFWSLNFYMKEFLRYHKWPRVFSGVLSLKQWQFHLYNWACPTSMSYC